MHVRCLLVHVLTFAWPSLAGHPMWESRLNKSGTSRHDKRWITIKTEQGGTSFEGGGSGIPWPNSKIPYCFENTATRNQLAPYIRGGMNAWIGHGLPQTFEMNEVSLSKCNRRRSEHLMIKLHATEILTSIGKVPAQSPNDGPIMKLSTSEDIGARDIRVNIAHEIGHAWGLVHEHQRSNYWDAGRYPGAYRPGLDSRDVFRLHCNRLADFRQGMHPDACISQSIATENKFSAMHILPVGSPHYLQPDFVDSEAGIDWNSIMLYGSTFGGRPTGGPPGADNREIVLTKSDGTTFVPRTNPSQQDILALTQLYEAAANTPPQEPMMGDPRNSRTGRFLKKVGFRSGCI